MQQLKTDMTIRKFEERDYAGVVAVGNAIFPDRPGTVEEWRYDDEQLAINRKFGFVRQPAWITFMKEF
ncbi:MAG: hypothetical protein ACRDGM_19395 [bacterium]